MERFRDQESMATRWRRLLESPEAASDPAERALTDLAAAVESDEPADLDSLRRPGRKRFRVRFDDERAGR